MDRLWSPRALVRAALVLAVLWVVLLGALAVAAQARPVGAGDDDRPNILVVMTDDMALADLQQMPNVRRLLARQGTSFTGAVDSFPLCCPARATFNTGQYAHNHGVGGNFEPYGWYGMRDRPNTLPSWLQRAGYHTAAIGKWLNGYGALDGHGEIPTGFDDWRGLLDVSAYDYFNYVMNDNGVLRTWGDADFARKLVEFAKVEVEHLEHPGLAAVLHQLVAVMGPAPYTSWGSANPEDYSPDVTGRITEDLVAGQRHETKPFFIWWSPASPHREDVAVTLMGRPGPDPRPAPRYADAVKRLKLPRPPSFNEADLSDKPSNMRDALPPLTDAKIRQLELDYQGRAGALRAVDDHVARLVATLRRTNQLDNTLIVFVSDNGWLQGQHRVPGDKFLPYEESLRVPFILRGPGVPKGRVVRGQVANIDFAPTLVDAAGARAGRTMDGVSLLPVARKPARRPQRAIALEALDSLFEGDFPQMFNGWDQPYQGVRTGRYTYVQYTKTGEKELYDRTRDPDQLRNVAGSPAYAKVQARLERTSAVLRDCRGAECRRRRAAPTRSRPVHIEGRTKSVPPVNLAGTITDRGTLTSTPFGPGTIELQAHLEDGRMLADVRMRFAKGTIRATATMVPKVTGNEVDFTGTTRFVGGTGAYRAITSGELTVHDHNTLDGQNGTITVSGRARW